MRRDLVYLTVLFWYVCTTLFLSITTFVSRCNPNVKWEEGVGAVHTFTRVYKHCFFFCKSKYCYGISQTSVKSRHLQQSLKCPMCKKKKKILCALALVLLYFPIPSIHSVTTSFKPIHAVCNGSLTRWRVSKLRDFRSFPFADHVKNVPL